ncbi:DUF2164 domain-containing protein [Gammaproteobacteria bacterium]|nr:DUF2164 domain-containing protein [Gammaproteobacteria bacterium]
MSDIEFSKGEKELLTQKLQNYLKDEFDQHIGQFDAEFFLDFISKEIGSYYYNLGLNDAQAVINSSLENISEAIYAIEKPTEFS